MLGVSMKLLGLKGSKFWNGIHDCKFEVQESTFCIRTARCLAQIHICMPFKDYKNKVVRVLPATLMQRDGYRAIRIVIVIATMQVQFMASRQKKRRTKLRH